LAGPAGDQWKRLGLPKGRKIAMNLPRILVFGAILLFTLTGLCVCRIFGKGHESVVPIRRNVVWNDFVSQIRYLPDDSPVNSFAKETLTIQRFLKEHATEARIGIYDLEVFKAIDRARARLQKADKDLETLWNELSYREEQAMLGR
jgi:hypothetical protein